MSDENDYNPAEDVLLELEPLLRKGEFTVVDAWLAREDPEDLDPVATLAALTITFWGKDKLTKRDLFLERAEVALKRQLGTQRAEALLRHRR